MRKLVTGAIVCLGVGCVWQEASAQELTLFDEALPIADQDSDPTVGLIPIGNGLVAVAWRGAQRNDLYVQVYEPLTGERYETPVHFEGFAHDLFSLAAGPKGEFAVAGLRDDDVVGGVWQRAAHDHE